MASGNFTIRLDGPPMSGKTVAMPVIEQALRDAGYEVVRSHASALGNEHTLSVRWSEETARGR